MPPVYAIISFFSYRYFRSYTYYELIEVVYEAVTISAFMWVSIPLLIIEYVASTAVNHSATKALERKDKRNLPIPVAFAVGGVLSVYYEEQWSVMQYVVVRPLVSIIAIICQAKNILCENAGFNFHFAYAYIEIIDCISITVALYGLLMFYGLTKDELKGKRPLAKFLCIKLIVMFTFYQSFVFSWLEGRVIHATQYWTETNIADGLTALTICIEMVLFAAGMMWAYPSSPYRKEGVKTNAFSALMDSLNFWDFVVEVTGSIKFFIGYLRKEPGMRSLKSWEASTGTARTSNFAQTFGMSSDDSLPSGKSRRGTKAGMGSYNGNARTAGVRSYDDYAQAEEGMTVRPSDQFSEHVRLTEFVKPHFANRNGTGSVDSDARSSDDTTGGVVPPPGRKNY
ncbi:hypothetical protein EW145_g981 [Phellinidium pouzarii]|uniref:Transmembrane protein 184C n=1 Tax=Phellinidium pouzarii TaxID=167371 RepID=A0A4V3XDS7_9AGAM|nr:hypothetical protein EW145_g981 [Phellinidium pouzarii]